MKNGETRILAAVIGGSGLYELAGLESVEEVQVDTPYGPPSDVFRVGTVGANRVAFLARHGRGHRILPGEINYRANIYALKLLGVQRVISASAVGSMRETVHPREVVLVDQFIDRTRQRVGTFFGDGVAAHVSLADPVCGVLREKLAEACRAAGAAFHERGTYLCMEGPAFSTRAESALHRSWGVDVIGMTNMPEARLAREAEICYATMALVTDYDCWHDGEDDVSVGSVLDNLRANTELAGRVLHHVLEQLPEGRGGCACEDALSHAIISDTTAIPTATRKRLQPLIGRYLDPA